MKRKEVKDLYKHMHEARESYVVAANAILVVAVDLDCHLNAFSLPQVVGNGQNTKRTGG